MAKFTGHACDREGCSTVANLSDPSKQTLPDGWYYLDPLAPDAKKFELCSARCVKMLAAERERMERPVKTGSGSERKIAGAHAGNHVRWHKQGKHEDDPREGCPMCEDLTAPSEVGV